MINELSALRETPKGETVPQTVENLQAIMARDADEMLRMKEEISKLTQKLNQARQKRRAIPEGFVLVPVEPTQEMLDVILNTHDVYGFAADLYKALLDAAQETDHEDN
jgi:transcription antitermination factor NusG